MKIGIIGAGNMGGAIVRGLALGSLIENKDITVADLSTEKLNELKEAAPSIITTHNNQQAVDGADIIILAVKPWLAKEIVGKLTFTGSQILASVAAGIPLCEYKEWIPEGITLFRLIPNTAISELESMTLIASLGASDEQEQMMLDIFNEMGRAMLIPESLAGATTALASCGIAYVFKYIQAAMQAGVEMGVYPKDAMKIVAQSVKGAAEIILNNDTHPSQEIDKVTTPGGYTIRGINELDHAGFMSAVIRAMKASS